MQQLLKKSTLIFSLFFIYTIQASQMYEDCKKFFSIRIVPINHRMYRIHMKCEDAPHSEFRESIKFRKNHHDIICAFIGTTCQELCSLPNFQFENHDIVARWYLHDRRLELEISGYPIIKNPM